MRYPILAILCVLVTLSCSKEDTLENIEPDTEQNDDTKKDDIFIDLTHAGDNHVVSLLNFLTYPEQPIISTGLGNHTPFEAAIDENGDTEITISMTYDGATNDYVLEEYKKMENVILPPEPYAIKLSIKINDANADNTVFNIDDSSLDYVHIQSIEFGISSTARW